MVFVTVLPAMHAKKRRCVVMKQCLRITLYVQKYDQKINDGIQKAAKKAGIEGTVQKINDKELSVFACGLKPPIDEFLDALHQKVATKQLDYLDIEPFLKDRDFRGVFRVIE
jgi:acylphosphatase